MADQPQIDKSHAAILRIASAGMQKATEETVKRHGEQLLRQLLPAILAAPFAGPLASAAAAMLASLVEGIFKQTSATERKLDRLLAEPFKTATRAVKNILLEQVQNDAEEAEAQRRLQHAADRLEQAFTYAEHERPQKQTLVRMYQAFVAALLEGGGAALRRDLGELHALVAAAREQSIWENAAADRVKNRENGVVAEAMQLHMQASRLFENPRLPGRGERIGSLPTAEQLQSTLTAREQGARDRAADWARQADDLEAMCQLLEKVHQERKQILRAPKQRSLLEAIRRKFS